MSPVLHLPHKFVLRCDRRVVARALSQAGVPAKSALHAALAELFLARLQSWRDFFALRRGPMARRTLLVLAVRSLSEDADAAAALAGLTKGQGQALLRALELFVVTRFAPECRRLVKAAAPAPAKPAVAQPVAAPEPEPATPAAEPIVLDRRRTYRAVPKATDRRLPPAATYYVPETLAA